MGWIQTYSGHHFDVEHPDPDTICIEDIAHALACNNRYTGHLNKPFSIAQHSVNVSKMCPSYSLYALLHDGSEAYLADVARPIKLLLPDYRVIEERIQSAIYRRFGLDPIPMPDEVRFADDACLRREAEWGFIGDVEWVKRFPIGGTRVTDAWPWYDAEILFLGRFRDLTK